MEEGQPKLSDTLLQDNYSLPAYGMDMTSYPQSQSVSRTDFPRNCARKCHKCHAARPEHMLSGPQPSKNPLNHLG